MSETPQVTKSNSPQAVSGLDAFKEQIWKSALHPLGHAVLLVALVVVCFGRTLGSYFLADDFGEISYVNRIVSGAPELIWSNFAGNYMQIPGMNVWRPWLLITLLMDFLVWRGNAAGYYLTNLLYYTGCVLVFYLTARTLTSSWSLRRSAATALFAAALFAVSPLHCESVSWVVGRVDIVSCFFYLSGLYLMLKSRTGRKKPCTVLAVVCLWLGLWTKEMAIGLPVLVAACGFLWPGEQQRGLRARALYAVRFSLPLLVSMAVYFAVRYLCLGTLVGGYTAGFGATQLSAMTQKWLDPDTLYRLVLPFSHYLYQGHNVYAQVLALCYGATLSAAAARLLAGDLSRRWLVFLGIWTATAAAPIFQLWGLGYNLEGSRFYFFLTLPLSLVLPVLVFQPSARGEQDAVFQRRIALLGALSLAAMTVVMARTAYNTNLLWVHAGQEVRLLSESAQTLVESSPPELRFIVLGIPKNHGGAHLILNGDTFAAMLAPPFLATDISSRFITFDPVMFSPAQFINATRLKATLAERDIAGLFVWSGAAQGFTHVRLDKPSPADPTELPIAVVQHRWQPHSEGHATYSAERSTIVLENARSGDGFAITGLELNPLAMDFLEMDVKYLRSPVPAVATAQWSGKLGAACNNNETPPPESGATQPVPTSAEHSFQKVRVRLSNHWRWFACGKVSDLFLGLFHSKRIEVKNMRLLPGRLLVPALSVPDAKPSRSGVYTLPAGQLTLEVDRQEVDGCSLLELEISKPNFFFANFSADQQMLAVARRVTLPASERSVVLSRVLFPAPGYYEVRCRCLNSFRRQVGEYSDTLTFHSTPR